jgi:hypothetical protein
VIEMRIGRSAGTGLCRMFPIYVINPGRVGKSQRQGNKASNNDMLRKYKNFLKCGTGDAQGKGKFGQHQNKGEQP